MIDDTRIREARKLCLFAHYHQDGIVAPHVIHYLHALRDAGFVTVVMSTASLDAAGCKALRMAGAEVILRENRGMDFGGWIEACQRFFPINADFLLLANDSVYGPITALPAFVDRLTAHDADFYGALESLEIAPHLQSWFILLRPSAYRSRAFAELMLVPMPVMSDKLTLVTHYEVGLTQRLVEAGLRYHAAFSPARQSSIARSHPYNPAHLLWRDVIKAGVPFLKVELLRLNRMRVTDVHKAPALITKYSPELGDMIRSDLLQRGTMPLPSFTEMSEWSAIYWPEVRALVLSDHRNGAGNLLSNVFHGLLARAILTFTRVPRRVHARWLKRRRRQSNFGHPI